MDRWSARLPIEPSKQFRVNAVTYLSESHETFPRFSCNLGRIVERPVQSAACTGKDRTFCFRIRAYGNDPAKALLAKKFHDTLGPLRIKIRANLIHHLVCFERNRPWIKTCT